MYGPAAGMCVTPQGAHPRRRGDNCADSEADGGSDTPPELVAKQQLLSGLLAAQALDPTSAPRALLIAETRFDINRLERKRKRK
eukprot:6182995-Pleurochrysis_carterae.AAC.1